MNKAFLLIFLVSVSAYAAEKFRIQQLQGAWWSNPSNPTADFSIEGNQVWLDYDSLYHPSKIEGNVLIFQLGDGMGSVKNRIVSLNGNILVLEHLETEQKRTLIRIK